jgi:hypothetical protein
MAAMTHDRDIHEATTPQEVPEDEEPLADPDDQPIGHDDDYDWDRR